jgi:phage recombination protein Bet
MKELEIVKEKEVFDVSVLNTYLDTFCNTTKLQENEKIMFLNIAKEFQLNPFKREIHITAYGEGQYRKFALITGYEVYIKRAERTGKLNGWKAWVEGSGENLSAKVQIYRKDWAYPFEHEVYYSECVQRSKEGKPNAIWQKQAKFMLRKVAIGQGFRLCFSDELGGMPYEEAELPNNETRNITPIKTELSVKEKKQLLGQKIKTLFATGEFTDEEIENTREFFKEEKDINILEKKYEQLKCEMIRRFETKTSAKEFEDDIPWTDEEQAREKEAVNNNLFSAEEDEELNKIWESKPELHLPDFC